MSINSKKNNVFVLSYFKKYF